MSNPGDMAIFKDPSFVALYDASAAYDSVFGPTEKEWLKSQTGIQDDDELKKHVLTCQEEAWKVFNYGCLRGFTYVKKVISRHPAYPDLLKLGRERKDAIFIDYACCFGNDLRNAVADGFPVKQAMASDLRPEFWELGHKLFRSTPETFPAHFVPSNVLELPFSGPVYEPPSTPAPFPLSSLTSLEPLVGHVAAVHVSAMFHLFDEASQRKAARSLAALLSPTPGSMIFGLHVTGMETVTRKGLRGEDSWIPSKETWTELWDGDVFKKGMVKVEIQVFNRNDFEWRRDTGHLPPHVLEALNYFMMWSVTRV